MGLIAAVLIPMVLFFWFAFCLTVWAWLRTIICLSECKFIRAALWFNVGTALVLWWTDKWESWDAFWPGAITFTCMGALGTFARFYNQHRRAVEAVPPFEPAPVVLNINISLNTNSHADRRAVQDALAALASALRDATSTGQGPRRISDPTIN